MSGWRLLVLETIKKLKLWEPIELNWLDSCHDSGWRKFKEFDNDDKWLKHISIGYYIKHTDNAVSFAQSRQLVDEDDAAIDAVMTIPVVAITSIRRLNDAR